jgi:hypothetical protein
VAFPLIQKRVQQWNSAVIYTNNLFNFLTIVIVIEPATLRRLINCADDGTALFTRKEGNEITKTYSFAEFYFDCDRLKETHYVVYVHMENSFEFVVIKIVTFKVLLLIFFLHYQFFYY